MLTTPSYFFLINPTSNNDPKNTTADINVDSTGTRFKQYIKSLKIINKFKTQSIFLSKYLDYKAPPKVYPDKKYSVVFIYAALNKCKSIDGLYFRSAKW